LKARTSATITRARHWRRLGRPRGRWWWLWLWRLWWLGRPHVVALPHEGASGTGAPCLQDAIQFNPSGGVAPCLVNQSAKASARTC
jgi:hypothetical protein